MDIVQLGPDWLAGEQFAQLLETENASGVSPWPPEVLMDYLASGRTLLCMDGKAVAGFIIVMQDMDYGFGGMHICNLNVAAPYRRKGLAQQMIRAACETFAPEYAGLTVTLDVEKTNHPALCLYEKLGFTVSDIPSENGPDNFVMTAKNSILLP